MHRLLGKEAQSSQSEDKTHPCQTNSSNDIPTIGAGSYRHILIELVIIAIAEQDIVMDEEVVW